MTAKWIGILVAIAVAFGAGFYFGGLSSRLAADNKVIKTQVAEQMKNTKDEATVAQEAKIYESATDPLAPVAAPHVSVCYYQPAPVPSPKPTGSGAHEAPPSRAPDPGPSVPGPDIGRPLVQIGHNADAQIAGLQDYIAKVCQGGRT